MEATVNGMTKGNQLLLSEDGEQGQGQRGLLSPEAFADDCVIFLYIKNERETRQTRESSRDAGLGKKPRFGTCGYSNLEAE